MRFFLTLRPAVSNASLMWNYHYPLASWLYGIIAKADIEYAAFLHQKGYRLDKGKTFKHFTFSDLQAKIKFDKGSDGFRIISPTVQWKISFYMDKAAENFIAGLFQDQVIRLFNREYDTSFIVERVEVLPEPVFSSTTRFQATSAMVVAEKINGMDQYLEPTDVRFGELLVSGLIDKYLSVVQERGDVIEASIVEQAINFRLIDASNVRSRKITIKENKGAETEVRGYRDFIFELSGPKEVLEVGFLGGFGRYCAEGFGFCEIVE